MNNNIYSRSFVVPTAALLIAALVLFLIVIAWLLFSKDILPASLTPETKTSVESILSGLLAGLTLVILEVAINWKFFNIAERHKELKVIDILKTRNDESYYREVLRRASTQIDVMGVTASRFLEDFADLSSPLPEKKIVTHAMQQGLTVRILLPKRSRLQNKNQLKYEQSKAPIQELIEKFPEKFKVRYFDREPTSSLVRADNEVIVGPYLPPVESQNSPAIHAYYDGTLSKFYCQHFERLWEESAETDD